MSERPFVDTPPNRDVALAAARVAAVRWGLPEPHVLRLGMNLVCAAGDEVVLRVATPTAPAERAIWLAHHLADAGIRVPRPVRDDVVQHGGCQVVAVERIVAEGAIDWEEVGATVRRVHDLAIDEIGASYPLPPPTSFPWWHLDDLAAEVDGDLDELARQGLAAARRRVRAWPDLARDEPWVVCHGDLHPDNIIPTAAGPVLLDWDLMCRAPAAWDHAALLTWSTRWGGDAGVYPAFARGTGWSAVDDPLATLLAEGRLIAATLMRVRAGRSDGRAAAEAARRLAYWRGDPSAPAWVAQ